MADWSKLPSDLLCEIAGRLDSLQDMIYLSSVCKSWRTLGTEEKRKMSKRMMPWLMLPDRSNDIKNSPKFRPCCRQGGCRRVYDPSQKRFHHFKLPEKYGHRTFALMDGWILTVTHPKITVFNPFTNRRLTLPDAENEINRAYMCRVTNHDDDDGLRIFVIHGDRHMISFAKPGDVIWISVAEVVPLEDWIAHGIWIVKDVRDVVYSNGGIYIANFDRYSWKGKRFLTRLKVNEIIYADNNKRYALVENIPAVEPRSTVQHLSENLRYYDMKSMYLLDLFGDLLVVARYLYIPPINLPERCGFLNESPRTHRFEVFKFDLNAKKCVELGDVGDAALFVGTSSGVTVRASERINCKKNCIYFTQHDKLRLKVDHKVNDVGIYRLKDRVFETVYPGQEDENVKDEGVEFWFTPTF